VILASGRVRRFARGIALLILAWLSCSTAWAQIMDSIEINRVGKTAEITIHFSVQVQYMRHNPLKSGKVLRIFLRSEIPESGLTQQTLTSPQTDLAPHFHVTYPELGGAMAITFAQETRWEVRQGDDRRSIVVTLPMLAGAKDVTAEVRAVHEAAPAEQTPPAQSAAKTKATPAPIAATTPPASPKPPSAPTAATTPPAAPSSSQPVAPTPVLTSKQVEAMAKAFLDEARKAIADKDLALAVNRLNRTLGLPSNSQTEPAQALIGKVREMTGEIAKARAEYQLYLKLFPKGPAAAHIKERLAQLPETVPRHEPARALPTKPGPAKWSVYGSISQYLYRGNSHIEITTPPPPGQLDFTTNVLSLTDQNALISTVDLNARRRDGVHDTRLVVRDTNTKNYLATATRKNTNRLYNAYVEQSNRSAGYLFRVGRQNPSGGGVLERFDGVTAAYTFNDRWRVNGIAGVPVEFMSPYKKSFYSISVDRLPRPQHVGLSGYFLQQRLDGVVNREAVGIESRYFDMHKTLYGLLDYDIAFRDLNIAMLQGNYRTDDGTNYFTYFDHRKTPPLGLTNAASAYFSDPALSSLSFKQVIDTLGVDQVRADAKAMTANSDMLAIGVTHPYSPRWTFGTDYRAAKISGTDAVGLLPAMPGSGLNHVFSVQAIGNSLWADNDVGVVNASYIKGQTYKGQSLGLNYVFPYHDHWRLDSNLRYYHQNDDDGTVQRRWSPSLKLSYHWGEVTLEGEIGWEDVAIDGPTRIERSNRKYFFLGYRWDFR